MTLAVMWEARAVEGGVSELLGWARAQQLEPAPLRRETFTAAGDRVLVITWWAAGELAEPGELPELAEPDARLVARPVHRWHFTSLGTD